MASTTEHSALSEASTTTTPSAIITTPTLLIRPYHTGDIPSIAKEANNPLISRYMRNQFPNPYTTSDAAAWVDIATSRKPLINFAICHSPSGEYAGGIGLKTFPADDVEFRTMEIGYWLGEAHWGKGLATQAVRAFSRWAFEAFPELLRLEAGVFGPNLASGRVLEKAGYTLEGRRRNTGCKNGEVFDFVIYGLLREECLAWGDKNVT